MSDHIDKTDSIIYAEVARGLAAVRRGTCLEEHGPCHFCDEPLVPGLRFCNIDCRDDYEKVLAANVRAGRPG